MSDLARLLQQYGSGEQPNALAQDGVTYTGAPKKNALADALRVAGVPPQDEQGFLFSTVGGELKFNPYEAIKNFMAYRAPPGALSTSGDDAPIRASTDVAGWLGTSGLGLNAVGAVPRNALGSSGARAAANALPMDDPARLARARELGFDTSQTWYHGTPEANLESIKPGVRDPGAWFTTDIMNANNYARGPDATIHDVYLRTTKPFVVEMAPDAQSFVPVHEGKPLPFDNNVAIVKHAQRAGYDSVHFPDGNFTESGNTMVVFDPSAIRAREAVFDPASRTSANLLASSGAPINLIEYLLRRERE